MFRKIAIAGLGLIGGSIALAVKSKSPTTKVIGITRNPETLLKTGFQKYVDVVADYSNLGFLSEVEFCVISTVVSAIPNAFRTIKPFLRSDAVVTDVGSVKEWVVKQIDDSLFVGSHPMAGSEKSGVENADPKIFEDAVCVVTPFNSSEQNVKIVSEFWNFLGMKVLILPPEVHDMIVSETSHFVHIVSFLISDILSQSEYAKNLFYGVFGKGLLDTTRISKSDPSLWVEIFQMNKTNILKVLEKFIELASEIRDHISSEDWEYVKDVLDRAKKFRESLDCR
ncbi:MAG: prephenate dehydrogenase [Brevinematia bacterium]